MSFPSRLRGSFRTLLIASVLISALAALVSGPAMAKGPTQVTGAEKLWVSPNPVSNNIAANYTISGSGFKAFQAVNLYIVGPNGNTTMLFSGADSSGNLTATSWAPFLIGDGQASVTAYMGDRHMTVLARCTFQVI